MSIIPGTGVDCSTGLEALLAFAGPSGSPVLSASTITCKVLNIPAGINKYEVNYCKYNFYIISNITCKLLNIYQ